MHNILLPLLVAITLTIVALTTTTTAAAANTPCRFAPLYKQQDILTNETVRESFLSDVLTWERNFVHTIGIDAVTQMTRDGQRLDYDTGMPRGPGHEFSAPSKESLHLALLTLALDTKRQPRNRNNNNKNNQQQQQQPSAAIFFTVAEALATLETKFSFYEQFNTEFPGFGGFFPWYAFRKNTTTNQTIGIEPTWDWQNRVPLLDNGEMLWALFALKEVLESTNYRYATEHPVLVSRVRNQWQLLVDNVLPIFFDNVSGNLIAVVEGFNQSLSVAENKGKYSRPAWPSPPHTQYWLNDPYEGELATVFVYLFCENQMTPQQREQMWINKRKKLQSVNLTVTDPSTQQQQNITTMRGWWFSAHERWGLSFLPYRRSRVYERVFVNGERARTWYSATTTTSNSNSKSKTSPGLYASVNGPIPNNNGTFPYYSACGIQQIAFNTVYYDDVSTGYGSFPVFLAGASNPTPSNSRNNAHNARAVAAAWLHNYLSGRKMQNRYGATESTYLNGTAIAPLTTWDSKITTALAILGGVVDQVESGLLRYGKLKPLVDIIDTEWSRVFGADGPLPGESLPFMPPNAQFPAVLEDFASCN